jgi:hypothetical protein
VIAQHVAIANWGGGGRGGGIHNNSHAAGDGVSHHLDTPYGVGGEPRAAPHTLHSASSTTRGTRLLVCNGTHGHKEVAELVHVSSCQAPLLLNHQVLATQVLAQRLALVHDLHPARPQGHNPQTHGTWTQK